MRRWKQGDSLLIAARSTNELGMAEYEQIGQDGTVDVVLDERKQVVARQGVYLPAGDELA